MPVSAGFLPSAALNSPTGVGPAPPVRKLRGSVVPALVRGSVGPALVEGRRRSRVFLARVLCSRLVGL